MNKLLDRFLNYVSLDTQSKTHVRQVPSTPGQWRLARQLCDELDILGLADITLSEQGVVMARLPSNASWPVPVLGFIAHLDTSPDFSGKQVNPQIIENYRGGDIALGIGDEILSPVVFPVLHHLKGHTLITTDGKTLLGADDKAGIAEIITAMARLRASEIPHGEIRIAFTPDEEVGKGMDGFDTCAFAVDWAYTVDGGDVGEFEIENFNAASALVRITGNQVHPGSAKGVMINALSLAMHFHQALPAEQVPEKTADREGFYHLHQMKGTAEKAELHYLIRDFCQVEFVRRKQYLQDSGAALRASLPSGCHVDVQITDSYFNMHDKIAAHPHIIDITLQAMEECGVKPKMTAIRGGTDGARLSFMGIPCPNLFTGGYNFHGKHEFISLQNMEHAVSVITGIATLTAEKARINQLIPQQ